MYRILFGILLQILVFRFFSNHWIEKYFLKPKFFFKYYGWEWLPQLDSEYMIYLFILLFGFAFLITIGFLYRVSIVGFFLLFSYFHFYDQSYYLNHYYLVSLLCFLLIWIPADKRFSVYSYFRKSTEQQTKAWHLYILLFQISVVYFFGFVAKLKTDWIFEALPLQLWLLQQSDFPLIGSILTLPITAYFFSYFAILFDLLIPFLLFSKKFKKLGFILAILFHISTAMFFQIGMFPWIMLISILLFIEPEVWEDFLVRIKKNHTAVSEEILLEEKPIQASRKILLPIFILLYIFFQILFPLRFLLYPNSLAWSEEGFRFSWNIMIVEKRGNIEFRIHDKTHHKNFLVRAEDYLTPFQIYMMSYQPDMILQFVKFLKKDFLSKSMDVEIFVDCFVSLNGKESKRLIDETIDLSLETESFKPKKWILK